MTNWWRNSYLRSKIEYASNVWGQSINVKQKNMLNSYEKRCFSIILSQKVSRQNYSKCATQLNTEILSNRRVKLLKNFGTKLLESKRLYNWIEPYLITSTRSRRSTNLFTKISCKKVRYQNSTLPILIDTLNNDPDFVLPKTYVLNRITTQYWGS